ncbi:MAG: IS200/IS605 family transposase [Acidobacteria bacterium]|nr:MAG: IS200/IS605 family transposase [Acidobacteriota bacterium]
MQYGTKRIGNLDFDTASHGVYDLGVPVVFGTKFRRKILADLPLLRALLSRWRARWAAAGIEFGGEPDRIHFLLRYPPTVNLSAVVRTLKSRSASAYLNRFGAFYWRRHSRTRWSGGFFLCSVGGATLDILKAYLEQQGC